MANWKVWMKSTGGFYEQYRGHVDVVADDHQAAVQRALLKLKTGAFKERDDSMWMIEKVEQVSK